MAQSNILITGATGNVGSELIKKLSTSNIPFTALVRDAGKTGDLKYFPQASIVMGDLADKVSLVQALQGIEKAFLLTNSSKEAEQLQLNFVDAAWEAGVKHIVKLSQLAADEQAPVRFLQYHARVERRIRESGMDYTFLRPNLYMQGFIAFGDHIRKEGKFYASVGRAAVSVVDVRDIAAVAAVALAEQGHENKIYNITGEEALTHYEMGAIFSKVLGKQVEFVDVTPTQMEGAVRAVGFPEWQVGGLIEDYAHYARGEASAVYHTVRDVTGHIAIRFEQFVEDHRALFS